MAGIILAGGKSSRLGRDKAFEPVGGVPIIERVIAAAGQTAVKLFIVSNDPRKFSAYSDRAELLRDEIPSLGPLGGLYTALLATPDRHNFLVPCDAPFIQPELLKYLLKTLPGYDAVVPRSGERAHTTLAGYSITCLPAIEKQLSLGKLRVDSFFGDIRVKYLKDDDTRAYDPEGLSFFNVNTAADLAEAEKLSIGE
jgi:molybdenum cofactor guanylyltransferase